MSTKRALPARAWLWLAALAVVTAFLFRAQLALAVDVENDALKAVGTLEARTQAERIRRFGRDEVVIAVFQALPVGGGRITEVEEHGLAELAAKVRALSGVRALDEIKSERAGSRVWSVQLDVASGNYAPVVEELEHLLREHAPASVRTSVSGQPLGEVVIARELQAEQRRIVPLLAAVLVALLFAYYRHAGLVVAILLPAATGIVWTSGIYALLGRELDPVSVMLQPVLLTVGVAAGVHWIEAYLEERTRGRDAREAAQLAVDELRLPAMLAALTTVVGFLSLSFNAIPAVVDFGVFAALGVALTYWIANLATPALLVVFAARIGPGLLARRGRTLDLLGPRTADWLARRALAIRACAALIALVALATWVKIEVDNDPQRVLPEEHRFRRDTAVVASELGGSEVFDVLVPPGSALADPVELGLFSAAVAHFDGVAGPAGAPLRTQDGAWLVSFLLEPSGSTARERLFDAVEARAHALGASEVHVAGTAVQVARDSGRLIRSTLWGTGTSMLVLFVVFWIGLRSAYYAWLAMIPNVLPCLIVYGALAVLEIPLSFATAMISSTMLGLIVDDTIHLLHRFRELRAGGLDSLRAIEQVYSHSGRAIVVTSVVLGLGFLVGVTGELSTTVEFSALATSTIAVAFLSDLVLLPAILVEPKLAERAAEEPIHA